MDDRGIQETPQFPSASKTVDDKGKFEDRKIFVSGFDAIANFFRRIFGSIKDGIKIFFSISP
jgi:hypothetical protein